MNIHERTLVLNAELIMHRLTDKPPCECCGGSQHIHAIEIKLQPEPSHAFPGEIDRNLNDFLASWLTDNKLLFEGRRLRMTFEASETPEEAEQRRFDEYVDNNYA